MITVILTGPPGVTTGVKALVKLMQDNIEQLICLYEIQKPNHSYDSFEYTFIALFREKNSMGQFVAFINEWGTNWGTESGGAGRRGYSQIQSFIEDNEIKPGIVRWDSIDSDLRDRLRSSTSRSARLNVWKEFLTEELADVMCSYLECVEYPLNEKWDRAIKSQK